jgi:hypothetical protein
LIRWRQIESSASGRCCGTEPGRYAPDTTGWTKAAITPERGHLLLLFYLLL